MRYAQGMKGLAAGLAVGAALGFLGGFAAGENEQKRDRLAETPAASPCLAHAEKTHDNMLIKVNEYRLSSGLPQLLNDRLLDSYAQLRAEEIASNGSYEAENPHQTKYGGFSAWEKDTTHASNSRGFKTVWEDIAKSASDSCSVLTEFQVSPTHNDSLVGKDAVSIGIGVSGDYVVLIVGTK